MFKNQPYHNEPEEFEKKTIARLAAIYFGTLKDQLERSLTEHEQGPEDQEKKNFINV